MAGFAETARAPFDLPEGDAEIVGGYNTEFGGMRFGSFFMAEYMEILIISGIGVTCFFGGWHGPGPVALAPLWVLIKILLGAAFFIWVRATLPRLRYDQLMSFGWKVLLPLATLNVLVTAIDPGGDLMATDWRAAAAPIDRGPEPGGVGAVYRVFGETLRGLKTTLGRLAEGHHVIQYPEEKTPVYPRFRGRHKLHRFEDTGLEKCVGCSLCAAACPAKCIRVVAAENDARATRCRPASATPRSTRSTCRAASSAATARWPARSTRSRWATTTSCPTTTAPI